MGRWPKFRVQKHKNTFARKVEGSALMRPDPPTPVSLTEQRQVRMHQIPWPPFHVHLETATEGCDLLLLCVQHGTLTPQHVGDRKCSRNFTCISRDKRPFLGDNIKIKIREQVLKMYTAFNCI
jgi:hypothetical protein